MTIKVVLLGDSGVGKTCLRAQFVHHVFTNAYKATIGGDYLTTSVSISESESVNLQIWDTAGQERFNSISQAFYRGADVCVLVYDITNYESALSTRDWFARFSQHCHVDNPGIVLVGNKLDRKSERQVHMEEVREILGDVDVDWDKNALEVSSRSLEEVGEVFLRVARMGEGGERRMEGFEIDLGEVRDRGCAC